MLNNNFSKTTTSKRWYIPSLLLLAACSGSETPLSSELPDAPLSISSSAHEQPNFLIIVLDDVGYSDIGAYGGEIETPNIDSLAREGLMFSNFYVAGTCSPTRSMLLTGVDHHRAGIGNMNAHMAENQKGQPGYEGFLNEHVLTIAERLKLANYHTFMAGKWHLGETEITSPAARGFDESFILINGGANHFDQTGLHAGYHPATYRENGVSVELGEEFSYSTDFYTNKIINYLKSVEGSDEPFFGYLAYTAPHWPLQAPRQDIEKYSGRYDAGWLAIRDERYERQQQLGLVSEINLPQISTDFPSWDNLSIEEQRYEAKRMEIFAAMLDRVDRKIGELVEYLRASGQYENTVIFFMSDNGSEGSPLQDRPPFLNWIENFDNSLENIGNASSYIFLEERWAQVGNTPHRLYKGLTTDGGIRVPGFVHYPAANNQASRYDGLVSVMDIVPTILDLAGLNDSGSEIDNLDLYDLQGISWFNLLNSSDHQVRNDHQGLGWELFNKTAYRMGEWKALKMEMPLGTGEWELYNIAQDPGETSELSRENTDLLYELVKKWDQYAIDNGVILGDAQPDR